MFKSFGIEDGLSNNNATVFLRDSKGFMWIGTTDGLNRFDDYSFRMRQEGTKFTFTIPLDLNTLKICK